MYIMLISGMTAIFYLKTSKIRRRMASRKYTYTILTKTYIVLTKTPLLYSKTGVYRGTIIFLILLKNIVCGYSLEPPRRGGSNEYPQSMFREEI